MNNGSYSIQITTKHIIITIIVHNPPLHVVRKSIFSLPPSRYTVVSNRPTIQILSFIILFRQAFY